MKEISLDAVIENIDVVIDFIDEYLHSIGCPPKTEMQINLAVEEIVSNIANYSYPDKKGTYTVYINDDAPAGNVELVVSDEGIKYNPLEKSDPDITLSADERQIGGLGIFLVKKVMDEVFYEYKDNKNILTMSKKIG